MLVEARRVASRTVPLDRMDYIAYSLSTSMGQLPIHPKYSYRNHNHDVVRSKLSYHSQIYFESLSELEVKNSILFWHGKSYFSP